MRPIWIFFQVLSVPWALLLLKVLRTHVVHENEVLYGNKSLVISNHECKLDPFFILTAYSVRYSVTHVPFRFPVLEEYMSKAFLGKVISLFGGFSIGSTIEQKAKNLFYSRSILEEGGSLVIFPEARLVSSVHNFEEFQKGYTYLITDNTQIILAKLENFHMFHTKIFAKKRPIITFKTIPSNTTKEEVLESIKEFYK